MVCQIFFESTHNCPEFVKLSWICIAKVCDINYILFLLFCVAIVSYCRMVDRIIFLVLEKKEQMELRPLVFL